MGNLFIDIMEEDFKRFFECYGEFSEVFINWDCGFGFICLEFRILVEIVKVELDGIIFKSRFLWICFVIYGVVLIVKNFFLVVFNELLE